MRETKFRGKAKLSITELNAVGIPHKNGWVYGSLVRNFFYESSTGDECIYIANPDFFPDYDSFDDFESLTVEVIPESVGQYTNLKDKNGKEIYEGDVIYHHHRNKEYRIQGIVRYEEKWAGFYFAENRGMNTTTTYEVIGNTYENPELLERDCIHCNGKGFNGLDYCSQCNQREVIRDV